MTTVGDWVEQVRETLSPGVVDQVNRLAADYEPGDLEITLERDITGVIPNQIITCGLNTFLVWSVDPTSRTLEVEPKWAGAPDVVVPSGSIVRLKPNVYTHRIFGAINDCLSELSSPLMGVFGVATQDIEQNPGQVAYDLSDCEQIEKVLRVQWGEPTDDFSEWMDLNSRQWQHRQQEATADFPSGHQLRIFDDTIDAGATLRIIYSRSLAAFDSLSQDVSMSLLPETAWDIPPLGAAASLSASSEYRRNIVTAQPDTRRASEVPPYALLNAHKNLRGEYERRVQQEASRLLAAYPPKLN